MVFPEVSRARLGRVVVVVPTATIEGLARTRVLCAASEPGGRQELFSVAHSFARGPDDSAGGSTTSIPPAGTAMRAHSDLRKILVGCEPTLLHTLFGAISHWRRRAARLKPCGLLASRVCRGERNCADRGFALRG